jgi:peptidyl-prolyl cis-trans isomerase SurA
MRIITICLIGLISNFSYSQSKSLDRIIALVNDQMILESDLNYYRMNVKDTSSKDCQILEKLIIDKLLYSKAVKDSIPINDEEVSAEIENRLNYFVSVFGSQEKMEKYYDKSLNEIKLSFKDEVRERLLADRAKNKLLAGMSPSPQDVKDYFRSLNADSIQYYNSEVQLAQIVIVPKISRELKRTIKAKAEKVRNELITKVSSFGTQAILYSDDPGSGSREGELGWIKHGEMVPEFEQAAFSLPVGQVSDIIETKFGFHILDVLEKKSDKVRVRHILFALKPDAEGLLSAEKFADSIRMNITNKKISFEKAVELYSDDIYYKPNGGILVQMKGKSRTTLFELGEVDPTIMSVVSEMKVGDISKPQPYLTVDRKVGYRLIRLTTETPPHKASLETDYYKIKELVFDKMKDKALNKWLDFYKNYVFIKLNDQYESCPNLQVLFKKN